MAEDTINVREPDPQLSQQDSAPKAEKKVQPEQAQKIDDEMDQRVKDFHRRFDDLVNNAAAGKKGLFSSPDRNAKRLQEDLAKLIKDIQNRQAKDAEESRKAVEAREQLLKKKAKADDFFKTEKAKIDAIAMEMQTKIQKMYDDLDKRRTEVLQAPDEDKKGLIDRFSGWMKNIYRNNVNELRKILGLPVKDEKKEQEAQKTAAETVVNQQSQPRTQSQTGQDGPAKTQDPQQIIDLLRHELDKQKELNAQLQQRIDDQDKKIKELESKLQKAQPQAENEPEKTELPRAEEGQQNKNAPANNIVTGGRLTPLVDINNVPDKYKDVVNSKELLTPNDFMAAFVYTALKNRDLNQKFKGMFDNLRKEDSENHVAPGSDIDYIGAFAWQALEYSIKTKSTAVACKSPRNVQCLAYPKESFDFHLNVKKLKSELCLFTGEGSNPDNEKDFDPEKYGAPQAEEMAKYITQVLENMDKSLQKGMNLQPAEMREVVKANSVEAINHFVQQGMSRKQAIDDVYNRYLKTWKYSASAVISNCIYRASEGGLKLWHERVANVPEKAAAIDAGFIDRNGERNSLASIRKNRFTGVLKEVPQSVQEKITEDRKAQGLIR